MNRIIGNVYIIDSGGLWLTSNSASSGTFMNSEISAIGFYASDSGGELAISCSVDTSATLFRLRGNSQYVTTAFAAPILMDHKMYVNLCQTGTGFIYFS